MRRARVDVAGMVVDNSCIAERARIDRVRVVLGLRVLALMLGQLGRRGSERFVEQFGEIQAQLLGAHLLGAPPVQSS